MKLNKIFEDKYFARNVEKAEVRFYEFAYGCEPPIHTTSINLVELYKDWWDECNHCPENGTFIYAVEFNVNEEIFWMDSQSDFTFEELMETFRRHFPQYEPNEVSVVEVKMTGYARVKHRMGESVEEIYKKVDDMVRNVSFGGIESVSWESKFNH